MPREGGGGGGGGLIKKDAVFEGGLIAVLVLSLMDLIFSMA